MKAPKGAPNVVVMLIDDFSFGQASTFGGAIEMPTLDRLVGDGLRYNQLHVAAVLADARGPGHRPQPLLRQCRRRHGCRDRISGNTGVRPNNSAPPAEILRLNGYSTAAFGKYHETAPWEVSPSGPTALVLFMERRR